MMYVGGVPWHGLGTALDKPATAEEAIRAARLNWSVKKLSLYASDGDNSLLRLPVPDKYAVARENSLDVLGRRGVAGRLYPGAKPGGLRLLRPGGWKASGGLPYRRGAGQGRARVDLGQAARLHPCGW